MVKRRLRVIVACRIFEPELEMIRDASDGVEIRYIDQGFHMTPRKMGPAIQEQVDLVSGKSDKIVLGYGLCANGIVGVKAREQGLYVPKSHDCIALFMGSGDTYRKAIKTRPGTFYLTAGWIADRKDPLSYMEDVYTPRMGRETAEWGMKEELKNYSHFALINTGAGNLNQLRKQTLKNATFFDKEFDELPGSLMLFRKMVMGPLQGNEFLFIKPGAAVRQNLFIDYGQKASPEKTVLEPNLPPLQPSLAAGSDHPVKVTGPDK
jgi:hypothetical protein